MVQLYIETLHLVFHILQRFHLEAGNLQTPAAILAKSSLHTFVIYMKFTF